MEDLHEALDRIHEAEHAPSPRLRLLITSAILVVTALGVLAAYSAAHADGRAVHSQTYQELRAARAEDQLARRNAFEALAAEELHREKLAFDEAFVYQLAFDRDPSSAQAQLSRSDGLQAAADHDLRSAHRAAEIYERKVALGELSGAVTKAERRKQDENISSAGMLAIALFLLGLVLAVKQAFARGLFITTAVVITCVSGVRMVRTHDVAVPALHEFALTSFETAQGEVYAGKFRLAVRHLRVAGEGGLPGAWGTLGSCLSGTTCGSGGTPHELASAVVAYHRALALSPEDINMWNAVARDELFLGRLTDAANDLAHPLRLAHGVDRSYVYGLRAEIDVAGRDSTAAAQAIARSLGFLTGRSAAWRENYFATMRRDAAVLQATDLWTPAMDEFYARLRTAEASWDAIGAARPQPLGGFVLAQTVLGYTGLDETSPQGYLTVHLDYDCPAGSGVFSMRVYSVRGTRYQLEPGSSVLRADQWDWSGHRRMFHVPLPSATGSRDFLIEFYWNGNFLTAQQVDATG